MTPTTLKQVDAKRGLIRTDLLNFRWVDELVLSPSAEWLAYTVKRTHSADNGYETHLYVRELSTGETQRLTQDGGTASSIAWSADSSSLAYSWQGKQGASVLIWSANSGATRTFATPIGTLRSLDWSPDGKQLAGICWTTQRHADDYRPPPGVPQPSVKVVRRLRYKQDGTGWVHDRFSQVWLMDTATGDLQQLTTSECDYMEPKWSHHGGRLAFVAMAREQNIALGQGQILIYDTSSGTIQPLLPDWQGVCRSPAWGEDDTVIAFAGHNHPAPTNRRIFSQPYVADVAAGTARKLNESIDEEVGNYAVADQRAGLSNITVRWAADDPWIYYLLTEQGATNLYRINLKGDIEQLAGGDSVTFEYSPAAGDIVAYGQANPHNPGEVYVWRSGQVEKVTDLNPWLRDHKLAVPQAYWYDGLDGARVHAWIMTPPDFDETLRYPTILYVHCSMFSWDFNHEFQCLANAGYIVAYFNQRGTTAGYGQAWTRASEGDQGGGDYQEIMLGVDELVSRPYVDETRLGVTGGSCGGFMTNWIVGHTNRFAAAVTQRSISNQISFFGTSDIGPEGTRGEAGANPWEDMEKVWQQSPIAYAAEVQTPLLIIHSDQDYRCALEQAEELFAALRWMGKEVELVIFEGESHGLSRGGRPGNRIERLRRIQGWFEDHLGTDPVQNELGNQTGG
jgi:dipeptidyl aminopeptidase/acylaminoacyl peptidase